MRLLRQSRDQRRYVAVSLVDALGSGLFMPVSIFFLTRSVGIPAVRVGVGLTIAGAVGLLATPVAGALADRYDARAVSAVCFALTAVGFVAYTRVDSFASFVLVASAIELTERLERTATKVLALSLAEGDGRIRLLAYDRSTRNAGYALGGVLASAALVAGSREAYVAVLLANAASFAFGALAVWRLPHARTAARAAAAGGFRTVLRDRRYVALAALSSGLWLNDSILKVGIPLWIARRTSASPSTMGLLFTLNTVLVVALQVRTSAGGASVRGAARAYRRAGLCLLAACALFPLAARGGAAVAIAVLVAATAVLTLGELFASAAEWGVSVGLAREELRGRYLSVFATGSSLQQAVGPALVGFALVRAGGWGWLGAGAFLLAAGAGARLVALRAAR